MIRVSEQPFSWLQRRVDRSMARVIILHLAILGGAIFIAVFESSNAILIAIIVLKTGVELPGEA